MPVGVAVAGLGEIGRLHARNLAAGVPRAPLLCVVDQVAELARELAGELEVAWSTSFERVLADSRVGAVVIATPTPLHAEMVGACARAGKHVLCEKPLSLDERTGREAARAMSSAGLRLQLGFQRRFDSDWRAAKRALDAGEIGELRLLRISHRNRVHPHGGSAERLGGLFADMAVHDMDAARWLAGEVADVSARGDDESAVITLAFESGSLGMVDITRSAAYGFECAAELVGTRGTLRIGWSAGVERLTPDGSIVALPRDHIERHRPAYLEELRDFVDCVESGREPRVGGDDAVAALALALAAERSCASR